MLSYHGEAAHRHRNRSSPTVRVPHTSSPDGSKRQHIGGLGNDPSLERVLVPAHTRRFFSKAYNPRADGLAV
jgi:hypothetical protein